jgi:hypothetical protein
MNTTRLCLAAGGLLVAGLACASGRVTIVSAAALPEKWTPAPDAPKVVAGYPSNAVDKSHDVCVSIGYEIGADGSTSGFNELNSWTSGAPDGAATPMEITPYSQIAAAVVSRYKYVPVGKPHVVFTSATFAFDGSKTQGEAAIRAHCDIANLNDFVAQLKSKSQDKGNLDTEALRRRRNAVDESLRPSNSPTGRY